MNEYTGGKGASRELLQRRYAAQSVEDVEDGLQGRFNWIVKPNDSDTPIGFVQTTVEQSGPELVANTDRAIPWRHQIQNDKTLMTRIPG